MTTRLPALQQRSEIHSDFRGGFGAERARRGGDYQRLLARVQRRLVQREGEGDGLVVHDPHYLFRGVVEEQGVEVHVRAVEDDVWLVRDAH